MKAIWTQILRANFRFGRMCHARAVQHSGGNSALFADRM